eukprot:775870-Rhodomonas_salina.1
MACVHGTELGGTELGGVLYSNRRSVVLTSGTELGDEQYGTELGDEQYYCAELRGLLQHCSLLQSLDLASTALGATVLRGSYAQSGTDVRYAPTRKQPDSRERETDGPCPQVPNPPKLDEIE